MFYLRCYLSSAVRAGELGNNLDDDWEDYSEGGSTFVLGPENKTDKAKMWDTVLHLEDIQETIGVQRIVSPLRRNLTN
ncbi:hypothetical protein HYALB_00011178 [Hymenoscyphus albidus]|uniref:Uncharacterized protein n=1 Tax=Hymenoscyphus albidus TaxID=595503 RepID=A0A9N9LMF7_9HELO|nr:hypothetical protein HYALB_00011178 [Hymenoscyphus albidus]